MQIIILFAMATSSLVAVSVWLILSDWEQFNPVRRLVKQSLLTVENVYLRLARQYFPKQNVFSKLNNYLRVVVLRSGIRKYLPWFNERYLAFTMVAIFIGTSFYFQKLGPVGMLYSAVSVFVLFTLLLLMAALNKNAIRKMYLHFLNVYSGFTLVEQSEMAALERTSDYVEEPLRTILQRWTTLHKTSQRSMEECLDGILEEIGDKEFRKFFKFTKVNARYGGDYQKALMKLKDQGEKLQSIYAIKTSSAIVGTIAILFMIACNVLLLSNALKDPQVLHYLKTLNGQVSLVGNALAVSFAIYIVFDINKN